MLIDILLIVVGFALVAKGGDLFVDSSIRIGKALAIPRIVIGGTLVSLATTAPELVVSVTAALRGDPGMALGNAIGSCICNIGLIVGAVALIVPVDADRADFIRRALWMAAGGLLVVGFSWDLSMERVFGWILLAGAFGYLGWDLFGILRARQGGDTASEVDAEARAGLGGAVAWFTLGGGCVLAGSYFLVTSGQNLALAAGIQETELASWLGSQMSVLKGTPVWVLIPMTCLLAVLLTETTSNIATVLMISPVITETAVEIGVHPYLLLIPAAIMASFAFMLPVATPPNAIVFGSGWVTIPQMFRAGVALDAIALVLVPVLVYLLGSFVFPFQL